MIENCFLYNRCNHKDCSAPVCLREYKLRSLYNQANMPEVGWKPVDFYIDKDGTDLAEFEQLKKIAMNITDFVNNGSNLFLHSEICGNGKSSWAIKMMQCYFDKIWPKAPLACKALFISVPRLLVAIKDNISNKNEYYNHIKENVQSADLVVWDDIAAKVGSEFEINHLLSMIEGRIATNKANIYTSNLNATQMSAALGDRLTSRVCNLSIDIELHGADKRNLVEELKNSAESANL